MLAINNFKRVVTKLRKWYYSSMSTTETRACLFIDFEAEAGVPLMEYDVGVCLEAKEVVSIDHPAIPVPRKTCLEQRGLRLCPRTMPDGTYPDLLVSARDSKTET